MSYDLLRSLYLGHATNADLTTAAVRGRLHVVTGLDSGLPSLLATGRDLVVTGNPGDGKSHLIRYLSDKGRIEAEVEYDLSAKEPEEVVRRWAAVRAAGRRFVLCANEGPLLDLLPHLEAVPPLAPGARELRAQVGHLIAPRPEKLAATPKDVVLVDLADRNVLDVGQVERAIGTVCLPEFFPTERVAADGIPGRNMRIFQEAQDAPQRLARILAAAGRHWGEHVTYRALWGAIAYAITGGWSDNTLKQQAGRAYLNPLDLLASGNGQGPLIDAVRRFADPAAIQTPTLDEDIWRRGSPQGDWDMEVDLGEPPAKLWERGERTEALRLHASLKRLAAIAHPAGDELVAAVEGQTADLPREHNDDVLLARCVEGIQRLYLSPAEDSVAPAWLRRGLPLWTSLSYQNIAAEQRPHVAVASVRPEDLEILRPRRVSWLAGLLGPVPELAWLCHRPSGITLRVDPALLAQLRAAPGSDGPLSLPERIERFLALISGWEEARAATGGPFAILERPRGSLLSSGMIHPTAGGYAYGADAPS